MVDGYGWPITGIFDLGWHEKTKYRVDPGFYSVEVSILVNKTAWDKLSDAQKAVLRKAAEQGEQEAAAEFKAENEKDIKRQADAGIQVIKFDGAAARGLAQEGLRHGWEGVIKQSPEHGPKMKALFWRSSTSHCRSELRHGAAVRWFGRLLDLPDGSSPACCCSP